MEQFKTLGFHEQRAALWDASLTSKVTNVLRPFSRNRLQDDLYCWTKSLNHIFDGHEKKYSTAGKEQVASSRQNPSTAPAAMRYCSRTDYRIQAYRGDGAYYNKCQSRMSCRRSRRFWPMILVLLDVKKLGPWSPHFTNYEWWWPFV